VRDQVSHPPWKMYCGSAVVSVKYCVCGSLKGWHVLQCAWWKESNLTLDATCYISSVE
jgi:hypothetical protein